MMSVGEFFRKLNIILSDRDENTDENDMKLIFKIDNKEVEIKQFCVSVTNEKIIEFKGVK